MDDCDINDMNQEISEFLYEVAISIQSHFDMYGADELVTSWGARIDDAFYQHFEFIRLGFYDEITANTGSSIRYWLDQGIPIFVRIQNETYGGHFVVVDGYRRLTPFSPYKYHINMGWGAQSNKYYDITNIVTGSVEWEFSYAIPYAPFTIDLGRRFYNNSYCNESLKQDNSTVTRTQLGCVDISVPNETDLVSNTSIQLIWDNVNGAVDYEITIKALNSQTTYYNKVRTYGGHPYFEAPESLPPNDEIEVTINPVDEFGVVHQCDPYTFFTVSEPCDVDIVDIEIECASFTEYDLIVEFEEIGSGSYNLRAEDPDDVYAELTNIDGGTHTLEGIPNRQDVSVIVEKTSDTEHCFEIINVRGPRCHSSTFDFTWPPSEDECYETGEDLSVTWDEYGNTATIRLQLHNLLTSQIEYQTDFVINNGTHTLTIPNDAPEGYYMMRIVAADDPTATAQSGVFEIKENCSSECDPVIASLSEPRPSAIEFLGEDIDFQWSQNGPVTGPCAPQSYVFEIADNSDFSGATEVTRTSNHLSTSISTVGEYYWRVRVHHTNGDYGPWSAVRTLTISDRDNVGLSLQGCTQYSTPICQNESISVTATISNTSSVNWVGEVTASILNEEAGTGQIIETTDVTIPSNSSSTIEFIGIVRQEPDPNNRLVIWQEPIGGSLERIRGGSCQNLISIDINYCEDALDFDWNPTVIIEDEPVSFDDIYPGGTIYTRWYLPGGTPDVILDNSNARGIIFDNPGLYQVTCEVDTRDLGTLSRTKTIVVLSSDAYYPDLSFSNTSLSHDAALEDQYIDVNWSVQNSGVQKIKFQWVEYYFSDDDILDDLDYQYSYSQDDDYGTYLASGAQYRGSRHLKIPENTPDGTKYIILKLNSWNAPHREPDQNVENDVIAIPVEIITELPDLTLIDPYLSKSVVKAGEEFDVGIRFTNIGNGEVPSEGGLPRYHMYLSTDDILSPEDLDYHNGHWIENGSWAPSVHYYDAPNGAEAYYHERTVSILDVAKAGNYHLLLAFDIDLEYPARNNRRSESDESNNVIAMPITVTNGNQPSVQSHNLRITEYDETSITVCWDPGDGDGRVLVGNNQYERYLNKPIDNFDYVVNANWENAQRWTDGEGVRDNTRLLHDGPENCATVTNLESQVTYFFSVYEYNLESGNKDYLQTAPEIVLTTLRDTATSSWDIMRPRSDNLDYFGIFISQIIPNDSGILTFGNSMLESINNDSFFRMHRIYDDKVDGIDHRVIAVAQIDSTFLAVSEGNSYYKSIDLGNSWSKTTLAEIDESYDIKFFDSTEGLILSDDSSGNSVVLKSINGGCDWYQIYSVSDQRLRTIELYRNSAYLIGEFNSIHKSEDRGDTWTEIHNNLPSEWVTDLKVLSSTDLVATVRNNGLYRSYDGGYNWEKVNDTSPSARAHKLYFADNQRAVYFNNEIVTYTNDALMSWSAITHDMFSPQTSYLTNSGKLYFGGLGLHSIDITDLAPEECVENLIIQNSFKSLHKSSVSITTNGSLLSDLGANSLLRSASIQLNPGVHLESGSIFAAVPDPCSVDTSASIRLNTMINPDIPIDYTTINITWSSNNLSDTISIDLLDLSLNPVATIAMNTPNDGYHQWIIDTTYSAGHYFLRLSGEIIMNGGTRTINTVSDTLILYNPVAEFNITSPTGGTYTAGTEDLSIRWTSQYNTSNINLVLIDDHESEILNITDNDLDDGIFSWAIPSSIDEGDYRITISEHNGGQGSDTSAEFTILSVPTITILTPVDSDEYLTGEDIMNITWTSSDINDNLIIKLVDTDNNEVANISNWAANDGQFDWPVPLSVAEGFYKVKIFEYSTENGLTYSDEFQLITPDYPLIDITEPVANITRNPGDLLRIRWTSIMIDDDVVIELYDSSNNYISTIDAETNNDGFYPWHIPSTQATGTYRIKMYEINTQDGLSYSADFIIE